MSFPRGVRQQTTGTAGTRLCLGCCEGWRPVLRGRVGGGRQAGTVAEARGENRTGVNLGRQGGGVLCLQRAGASSKCLHSPGVQSLLCRLVLTLFLFPAAQPYVFTLFAAVKTGSPFGPKTAFPSLRPCEVSRGLYRYLESVPALGEPCLPFHFRRVTP